MAARLVQSAAGPLDRPTTPFMFAVVGMASNWASKAPACDGIATFCQAPELITQLAAATAVLLLAHVTPRPVSVLPAESLVTAVNCRVAPTGTLAVVGLTVTDATGIVVIVTAAVSVSVPPLL